MPRMSADVQIRRASARDFDALGEAWAAHLADQCVWIAEDTGQPLGFLSLRPDGYIDLAYIRPEAQGRGLFARLYAALEAEALRLALPRLWTDASLHAKGPFERAGFTIIAPETVIRGGEAFQRFRMEKILNG